MGRRLWHRLAEQAMFCNPRISLSEKRKRKKKEEVMESHLLLTLAFRSA